MPYNNSPTARATGTRLQRRQRRRQHDIRSTSARRSTDSTLARSPHTDGRRRTWGSHRPLELPPEHMALAPTAATHGGPRPNSDPSRAKRGTATPAQAPPAHPDGTHEVPMLRTQAGRGGEHRRLANLPELQLPHEGTQPCGKRRRRHATGTTLNSPAPSKYSTLPLRHQRRLRIRPEIPQDICQGRRQDENEPADNDRGRAAWQPHQTRSRNVWRRGAAGRRSECAHVHERGGSLQRHWCSSPRKDMRV